MTQTLLEKIFKKKALKLKQKTKQKKLKKKEHYIKKQMTILIPTKFQKVQKYLVTKQNGKLTY